MLHRTVSYYHQIRMATPASNPEPTVESPRPALASEAQLGEELRHIPVFEDLSNETIDWLVSHITQASFETGDILIREGEPADRMTILLEGEIRATQESGSGNDNRVFQARAGMVVGLLPYSRLAVMPLTTRATAPTRVGWIHKDHFPEMIATLPNLVSRLVGVLADRIRDFTVEHQQRDKLMSLGRLSAGLAHELNNPAAAAQRSTEALQETLKSMRQANRRLQARELSVEQRGHLAKLEAEWDGTVCSAATLNSIERSDLEDKFSDWLANHGVEEGWLIAPSLVEASCDLALLEELSKLFSGPALADALAKLSGSFTISRLVGEIQNATRRISELVLSVKEYSYMDQAPEQDVDIHRSLDSTLVMMQHRFKQGVEIRREYDVSLPTLCAFGSELNQVWTNLIDNAVDAMDGKGVITIHTSREFGQLKVEICDTGKGIPENVKGRIFDPFFTTKKVGEGTGLGLDTVFRVVKKHEGTVKFESKPGDTRFQVYLPFARGAAAKAHSYV